MGGFAGEIVVAVPAGRVLGNGWPVAAAATATRRSLSA
jgi:hypothetical protein